METKIETSGWQDNVARSVQNKIRRVAESEFAILLHDPHVREHSSEIHTLFDRASSVTPYDFAVLQENDGVERARLLDVSAVQIRLKPSWERLSAAQTALRRVSKQVPIIREMQDTIGRLAAKATEFDEQAREANRTGDPETAKTAYERATALRTKIERKQKRLSGESTTLESLRQRLHDAFSDPSSSAAAFESWPPNSLRSALEEEFTHVIEAEATEHKPRNRVPKTLYYATITAGVLFLIVSGAVLVDEKFFAERRKQKFALPRLSQRAFTETTHKPIADLRQNRSLATAKFFKNKLAQCTKGIDDGCRKLDRIFNDGMSLPAGFEDTFISGHRILCERGYGQHCTWLGTAHKEARHNLKKDVMKALSLYARACELKNAMGCNNLGTMLTSVVPIIGIRMLWKSCRLGYDAKSCDTAKDFDGYMQGYMKEGVVTAGGKKIKFSQIASHPGDPEDWRVAITLNDNGTQEIQFTSDVKDPFRKKIDECQAGSSDGCLYAATMLSRGLHTEADHHRSASLYMKACQMGSGAACFNYGAMMRDGLGMPSDVEGAITHYEKSCDLGFAMGCYAVADAGGASLSYKKARWYYELSCKGGYRHGCEALNSPSRL